MKIRTSATRAYSLKTLEFEIRFMRVTDRFNHLMHYRVLLNGEEIDRIKSDYKAKQEFWKYVEGRKP